MHRVATGKGRNRARGAGRARTRRLAARIVLLAALPLLLQARPVAGAEPVPGRLVLRLSREGVRAWRTGTLQLPRPAGREKTPVRLEPLFVTREGPLASYFVLTVPAEDATENEVWVRALTSDSAVRDATSDRRMDLSALPDDPYLQGAPLNEDPAARQFHLYNPGGLDLRATEAWPFLPAGSRAVAAILDSGVDWRHPDLGGSDPPDTGILWRNEAEWMGVEGVDDDGNGYVDDGIGWDFVNVAEDLPGESYDAREDAADPDNDPSDLAGHGTQVAGLVTALTGNGLGLAGAPQGAVRLMPLRVGWMRPDGRAVVWMSYCARALEYAALMGADVANCSWDSIDVLGLGAALDFAIGEHEVVVVGSAGNGGTSSTAIEYLASRPDCIGVAAILENGRKASFSNYGSWVDIAAFGRGMVTTYLDRTSGTSTYVVNRTGGTSFSAPQVTGQAAFLRALAPQATAAAVREAISGSGRDLSPYEPTYAGALGGGLADWAAAVEWMEGGWVRPWNGSGLTPLAEGFAWVADSALVRADTTGTAAVLAPVAPGTVLPAVADFGAGREEVLVAAFGDTVLAVAADGSLPPGWPVALGSAVRELMAADVDGDGTDEVVVATGSGVTILVADGTVVTEVAQLRHGLFAADLDASRAGLEWGGIDPDGFLRVADGTGAAVPGWGEHRPGTGGAPPVAAQLGAEEPVSVVAVETEGGGAWVLHAYQGAGERAGFPVTGDGVAPRFLSVAGSRETGRAGIVAADSAGTVHRFAVEGTSVVHEDVSAGGPLAGEVLAADLDGDYQTDLVALRADGTLVGWDWYLAPLAGFPRSFPGSAGESPVALDLDGRRVLAVRDTTFTWVLPFGGAGRPAPWPAARGGGARRASVSFAAVTPVMPRAEVAWSGGREGEACWNGDAAAEGTALRWVALPSGRTLWEGEPAAEGCVGLSPPADADSLRLDRRECDGRWIALGSLALPLPAALTVGTPSPNPFRTGTGISYTAPEPVTVEVLDTRGRLLLRLHVPAGRGRFVWNGRDGRDLGVPAGIYFLRWRSGGETEVRRVVRLQ